MTSDRSIIGYFNLLLTCLVLISGCATPEYSDPQVAEDLNDRTGHSFGTQIEPGVFALPPGISLNNALSIEEAVAIALWNNAALQELLSELGLARAEFTQAGQIANPLFSVLFPVGPKQLEFSAKFPLETLWLRPARLEASDLDAQMVAERVVQGGLDLVRDVKIACSNLRLATATAAVKKDAVSLLQKIAALTDSRYRAGDISEFDLATVRIDSLTTEQEWRQAEAEIAVTKSTLHTLMGLGQNSVDFSLSDTGSPEPIERGVDELLRDALAIRPDLRAAELALEAAGKRAELSEKEIFQLTAILDANGSGSDFEIGPGVELPIPLFNQNQGGKAIAEAKLEQAARRYITLSHQIALEVRQAYARWQQALQAVMAWDKQLLPALESSLKLTQIGVQSGDLPPLQSLESEYKLNTARLIYHKALAEWQNAVAELEHSIGHRLDLKPVTKK